MDANRLGHALATLINSPYIRVNAWAKGGFDQWLAARQRDARRDYQQLIDGRLDLKASRLRWTKACAFVAANTAKMDEAKGRRFTTDVAQMIHFIVEVFAASSSDTTFQPSCPRCNVDAVLDDPMHDCTNGRHRYEDEDNEYLVTP